MVLFAGLLLAAPLEAQTLYEQAQAAFRRNQLDSAYDLAQRAAAAEPNWAAAQWFLGLVACDEAMRAGALRAFGLARRCRAAFSRAVELAPDSVPYLASLALYLAAAPGITGGDKDSALKLGERVRQRDEVEGGFLLANIWWLGNAAAKARSDSTIEALRRSRAGDRVLQVRAADWWQTSDRPERALAVYEGLVARDPNDAVAHFFVGRQLVLMHRELRRAQGELRLAAAAPAPSGQYAFSPGAPWWRLGQSYVQLGMPDSARICFQEALRLNPAVRVFQQSLDSLQRGGR